MLRRIFMFIALLALCALPNVPARALTTPDVADAADAVTFTSTYAWYDHGSNLGMEGVRSIFTGVVVEFIVLDGVVSVESAWVEVIALDGELSPVKTILGLTHFTAESFAFSETATFVHGELPPETGFKSVDLLVVPGDSSACWLWSPAYRSIVTSGETLLAL